jgi:NAD(P)H dehydrogenase (quinone)
VSFSDARGKGLPEEKLAAARYQGGRVARFAAILAALRADELLGTC